MIIQNFYVDGTGVELDYRPRLIAEWFTMRTAIFLF